MSPISRMSVVAGGLALALSAGSSSSFAEDAVRQSFGSWTVTIQPGIRGSAPRDHGAARMRLVSQAESSPADATAIPPAPAAAPTQPPAPAPGLLEDAVATPAPAQVTIQPRTLVQSYNQVYNSIPFSRAEYVANPSYRHDATMEFLFGQLRPTVIQRGTTVIRQQSSATNYGYGMPYSPYGFNSYYYPFYGTGYYPIYDYNLW